MKTVLETPTHRQIVIQAWPAVLSMDLLVLYTSMSRSTLWRTKFDRQLPHVPLSEDRKGFLREDVDEWLRKRRVVTREDEIRISGGRVRTRS